MRDALWWEGGGIITVIQRPFDFAIGRAGCRHACRNLPILARCDNSLNKEHYSAHEQCIILLPQSTFMASSLGVSLDQRSVGQRGQQTGLTRTDRLALGSR